MPQREFWTERYPTEIRFAFRIDPVLPDNPSSMSVIVRDQAGKEMGFGAGLVPAGFGPWAFTDAVRAAMEAFELGSAEDCPRAFQRCIAETKRAIRDRNTQEQRRPR